MSKEKLYAGEDVSAVVIDLGTNSIRAGYGGLYENPQYEIPAITGIVEESINNDFTKSFIFDDSKLYALSNDTECKRFIENSKVTDWDAFSNFIEYFLQQQAIDDLEIPLFFIEHPEFDRRRREKLAEIMFEKMNIPAISIFPNSPLVMLYKEKSVGTVIDFGSWHTTSSCVYNIYLLRNSVRSSMLGGNYFAERARELCESGNVNLPMKPSSNEQYDEFRKERAYSELGVQLFKVHKDEGNPMEENTKIAEAYFDSKYLSKPIEGYVNLIDLVSSSIKTTDPDIQYHLWKTFVTTGGCSQMQGLVTRIKSTTFGRYVPYVNGNTVIVKDPRWDAWKGGSIVVGTGTFQQQWYSMHQYQEGDQKMLFHY